MATPGRCGPLRSGEGRTSASMPIVPRARRGARYASPMHRIVVVELDRGRWAWVCDECSLISDDHPEREAARIEAHTHRRRVHPADPAPVAVS